MSRDLLFFSIAYLACFLIYAVVHGRRAKTDILHPGPIFAVILFLYSFASAAFAEEFGRTDLFTLISGRSIHIFYFSAMTGLISFGAGSVAGQSVKDQSFSWTPRFLQVSDAELTKVFVRSSLFAGILLLPFYFESFDFFHPTSYGEVSTSSRLDIAADSMGGVKQVLLHEAPAVMVLGAATIGALRWKARIPKAACVTMFGAYLAANTLSGWRGIVVAAVVMPITFYHYRVRPIRLRTVAVFGCIGFLSMNLASVARQSNRPSQVWQLITQTVSTNPSQVVDPEKSSELMVGLNLMRDIDGIHDGEAHYTFGKQLLGEFLVFIPRAFYKNRPLSEDQQFVYDYYPMLYQAGGGVGFFCLQEGYEAFGLAGIATTMFCFGWLMEMVYTWFHVHMSHDVIALAYSGVFYTLAISSARGGLIAAFRGGAECLVPYVPSLLVVVFCLRPWVHSPQRHSSRSHVEPDSAHSL